MNENTELPPYHIAVITIDPKTGSTVKKMIIDAGKFNHRKWLAKHSWWAWKSGFMVSTIHTSDEITFEERGKGKGDE